MKNKILYITYDSINDSISKSQILPLLKELSKIYEINLISFEKKIINKKFSFIQNFKQIKYGNSKITKIKSILLCFFVAFFLTKKENIKIIHCRSYIPAIIALLIKKFTGSKYIFDIRGFWFNEKYDAKLINFFLLKILKKIENKLYKNADYILTLTYKSIKYINKEYKISKKKISYIACFTDTKKFSFNKKTPNKELTFGYVGNVKLSYNFKKVLSFLEIFNTINKNWKLYFVNNYLSEKEKKNIFLKFKNKNKIFFYKSNFENINKIYKKFDVGIYFLKKDFSKTASCPTKLGEMLSCGIPIITNSGIGDIEMYLKNEKKCGFIIDDLKKSSLKEINSNLNNKKKILKLKINAKWIANKFFEKNKNILVYKKLYEKLIDSKVKI